MIDPLMPCGPLSCAYHGCRAVAKYVDANCEFIDGHALVIVDGGKVGNWMSNGEGEFCPEHWHVDETTGLCVSGPQSGGPSGTTPPLIERLGSETDLYYAVINRTDPAHAEEVFDQYTKILREVRSQAWKLGYAGGKAGFEPAANPYQDEEES